MDTLPKGLTKELFAFCSSISSEKPRFVPSIPLRDAVQSACFDNVKRKMVRAGGSIAYGWAIWQLRGVYFEAEHHGVWQKRTGELIDVSPQLNGYRKILFLPDQLAVYDPPNFRRNILGADNDNLNTLEFVGLAQLRIDIIHKYRVNEYSGLYVTNSDQIKINKIDAILRELLPGLKIT